MGYKGIRWFHVLIITCLCMLVCFAQFVFFSNKVGYLFSTLKIRDGLLFALCLLYLNVILFWHLKYTD